MSRLAISFAVLFVLALAFASSLANPLMSASGGASASGSASADGSGAAGMAGDGLGQLTGVMQTFVEKIGNKCEMVKPALSPVSKALSAGSSIAQMVTAFGEFHS